MTSKQINALRMRKILKNRFGIAIGIVLSTIVLTFVCESEQIRKAEEDASLINISGRQRMLSQRVALASLALLQSDSEKSSESCRQELSDVIELMRKSHEHLTRDADRSPERNMIYFMEGQLDSKLRDYLQTAEKTLASDDPDLSQKLARTAVDGQLLELLDQVVAAHQFEAESRIQTFQRLKTALTFVSLAALCVLVLFVFKPTIAMVTRSLENLENSNAELVEFSYRMSHDLRSPVVSSRCLSQLAGEMLEEGDTEEAKEAISRVEVSLEKLSVTVQDIAYLIKQSMSDAPVETFDLRQVINDAVDHARKLPGGDSVEFRILCDETFRVRTRQAPLSQSIENLISNAIKYRDQNRSLSNVIIEAQKRGNDIELSICDNGLGVDPKFQDQLFGMFKRFHPQVSVGSGLGLYLVSKNVAAIDGSVSYCPTKDGSCFTVKFPSHGA